MVKESYKDGGNGMDALSSAKRFSSGELKLSFSKSDASNAAAEALGQINTKYPYPPVDCDDALNKIDQIKAEIKQQNELIASGASKNVAQRYISAMNQVLGYFQNYSIASKCEKKVLAAEDAAFTDQWQDILNKEQAQTSGVTKTNTWIIFSVLGLLIVGSLVIILKKKKTS